MPLDHRLSSPARRRGRTAVCSLLFLLSGYVSSAASGCPILDEPHESWRTMDIGFIPRAHTSSGWKDLTALEARLHGMLLYWENDWGGDLEARAGLDLSTLSGGDPDSFVRSLAMARLFLQWSQRFAGGFGARVDAAPGLYTQLWETGSDSWAVPFGGTIVIPLDAHLAAQAGLSVYPGFSRPLDPRLGLRWRHDDSVRVDLAYPESYIRLRVFDGLDFFGGIRWQGWPEYGTKKDARGRMRLKETRAWTGASVRIAENIAFTAEGGYVFHRRIRFEEGDPRSVRVGDSVFFRVGAAWLY